MEIGLMVEGQDDLDWEQWIHIAHLADRLDFTSLFRSDHYFIGAQRASLETWTSLAVAARETSRVRFGPLVAPVTFRHPVDVGRMAAQLDLLSGGRFVLGVGNGWHEPEHVAYGIDFPEPAERTRRLAEAIHMMKAMWSPGSVSFSGEFYHLHEVDVLPKPAAGRPWLIIGGSGPKKTLRLVAEQANEWNFVAAPIETIKERLQTLERHCEATGRDPATIQKSMMTFGPVGPDRVTIERMMNHIPRIAGLPTYEEKHAAARARGQITGDAEAIIDQLGQLAELGIHEVEFQHFEFDDDSVPEFLASDVIPHVKNV